VCENRVLRRISGHKGEEVAGGWRELRNEELHDLCFARNIIRVMRINEDEMGNVARM
jgi:hypothetical protein